MIRVQNIYYMLAYAFQPLNETGYSYLSTEQFENIHNLLAEILLKGILKQVKRGLGKEYIQQSEFLSSPHGKIDISNTIKHSPRFTKISCVYDEFSENAYFNKILKTTALLMVRSREVDKDIKKRIKKSLVLMRNIEVIPVSNIRWDLLTYNQNNISYKMLMNICKLIIKGLLMSEVNGDVKFSNMLDDINMHKLYEKFILEYYRKHYPALKASPSKIRWDTDNGFTKDLPEMRSDITLQYNGHTLIIDAKYYGISMQNSRFNKKTIHSGNLYQIYTYVKNKDTENSGKVSGMLLYAKTDEKVFPNSTYMMRKNKISALTLDLNKPFEDIASQLDDIVISWQEDVKLCKQF